MKLLGDGLGDKEIAEKVGTTPNHAWAIRGASGIRPVSERQPQIAKAIVAQKRRESASVEKKMPATQDPLNLVPGARTPNLSSSIFHSSIG